MNPIFFYPFLAFAIAILVMPLCIRAGHRFGMFDLPDEERKIHKVKIPYTGGLAFIIAIGISATCMFVFSRWEFQSTGHASLVPMFLYIVEASLIIFVLGFIDDIRDLTFQRKFLFQFIAAFFIILGAIRSDVFPQVFDADSSGVLINSIGTLISVFWIVGTTNAINMIDGMDGLAAGTSIVSAVAMGSLCLLWGNGILAVVFFIIAAALLGFLLFNFNPARVFMGDTGSMFLGFILGVCGWLLVDSAPRRSTMYFVPIIVLGLPISDTLLAFFRRLIKRQNPFSADRFHIHHMLKSRYHMTVRRTVGTLYLLSMIYAGAGIVVALAPEVTGWIFIGGLVIAQAGLFHLLGYTELLFQEAGSVILAKSLQKTNGVHLHHVNGNGAAKKETTTKKED
ncbi:MAG: undecaprenyl/decaprenyl-phosphate alpha-N-acetylglucosaminyl 1-phosphate transferase [Ignavibacteria bacterium]|nr:undecaprenyl/decaprenyl-phosphate alpha-N-acetylglucosaminyl 1-phosphate transferase [Ignavibacteria bacterium]